MLAEDFSRFEVVIRKLEGVYGKTIDDGTMQAWWGALRDMPFEQVRERVDSHIRYGRHFPRPAEIRPKEDRPKETRDDSHIRAAERQANLNLDELWYEDRERWLEVVGPKVRELGEAKGMLPGMVEQKLRDYAPGKTSW